MIRYQLIEQTALKTFAHLFQKPHPFPVDIHALFKGLENCIVMGYRAYAKEIGKRTQDVIRFCKSQTGCTHYDQQSDGYLILYNDNPWIVEGRQRWTLCHEYGHIRLGHFQLNSCSLQDTLQSEKAVEIEKEADLFVSSLLAPFPLFSEFSIRMPDDIQEVFGLSHEAALIQYKLYLKWRHRRYLTCGEQKLRELYQNSRQAYSNTLVKKGTH